MTTTKSSQNIKVTRKANNMKTYKNFTVKRAEYIDHNEDKWYIYKIPEECQGHPCISYYVQKAGYGNIEMAFGYDPKEYNENLEVSVRLFIEDIKDDKEWF